MLKLSDLVRLLKPCSFKRGSGLTTAGSSGRHEQARDYAANRRPARAEVCPPSRFRLSFGIPRGFPMSANFSKPVMPRAINPLLADAATIERFIAHCHRRKYPARSDVFRPGDDAGTLYYIISGSVSIIASEEDGRELVLGYIGPGEFVGELGDRKSTRLNSSHDQISYAVF